LSFGSINTRPVNFEGNEPVTSVIGFAPVVVAKTFPFTRPTMRTLSSCRETAIVLIATGLTVETNVASGAWLTTDITRPPLDDR